MAEALLDRAQAVEHGAVGDRVLSMVHDASGSAGELLRVRAADLGRLPDRLTFAEGAAIPVAYMTAHVILHRHGTPQPGDKVLVRPPPAAPASRSCSSRAPPGPRSTAP